MVMAAWSGQREAIALMLEHGVDPGARREHDRQTALHAAAFQGDAPLVELLLRHGRRLTSPTPSTARRRSSGRCRPG